MKSIRLALASAAFAAISIAAPAFSAVTLNQPAPNFTLTDIDGHARQLADYKGKIVVLEWNNPNCPIVHKHYDSGNIPRIQHQALAHGVVWLLINSAGQGKDGAEYSSDQIKAWLKEKDSTPTAYLRDTDGRVGHLYAAKTTPHLFIINQSGVLVYEGAIDSIHSAKQSDIPKAENYVSEALSAVEAGRPVVKAATRPYGCPVHYGS